MATKSLDERQRRLGAVHLGNGNRTVQGHDRGRTQPDQEVVKPEDLGPVGVFRPPSAAMYRRDGCLKSKRASAETKGLYHQRQSLLNLLVIPECAVLFFQKHEVASGVEPSRSA